jgi:hypothetical protein
MVFRGGDPGLAGLLHKPDCGVPGALHTRILPVGSGKKRQAQYCPLQLHRQFLAWQCARA